MGSHNKLMAKDIQITKEGDQFQALLWRKYSTLKNVKFNKKNLKHKQEWKRIVKLLTTKYDIHYTTLDSYLTETVIRIDSFREFLKDELGEKLFNSVDWVEDRLKNYSEKIRDTCYLYNEGMDFEVIEKVLNLSKKFKLRYVESMALANMGLYRFNTNQPTEAIKRLEESILLTKHKITRKIEYIDLFIYNSTELSYVKHMTTKDPKESIKILKNIGKQMLTWNKQDIANYALYRYYYFYGYALKDMKQYEYMKKQFQKASCHAEKDEKKGTCYIGIALAHDFNLNYDEAIKTNEYILANFFSDNPKKQCLIYNNLATIYLKLNQINKAQENIKKSLDIMPDDLDINMKVQLFDTYLSSCVEKSDVSNTFNNITKALLDSHKVTENKEVVIRCFDKIIEMYRNDIEKLEMLKNILINLINKERSSKKVVQLKLKYADISILLEKLKLKGGLIG